MTEEEKTEFLELYELFENIKLEQVNIGTKNPVLRTTSKLLLNSLW
jgi:hypothetical protein